MSAPIKDINHLLHDLRSAHLRRLPAISGSMLSAGCAGIWYFDWITKQTGFTGRHIGLEYYTPKPTDLPGNVEWIENTVGDMNAVADASCELVFSGQNLEHLWPEEVIGFFLESARVLEPGGWLVVDSPNRLITSALGWSHPEHMVEFTPSEARRLAELAGFEVDRVLGMWLCRDPRSGRALPFDPLAVDPEWSLPERVLEAERHPDDSFLWWLVARRSGTPQPEALASAVNEIFAHAWPERQRRFVVGVGERSQVGERSVVTVGPEQSGPMSFGPYMPLRKGEYTAEWRIEVEAADNPDAIIIRCDVVGDKGRELSVKFFSANDIAAVNGLVSLDFSLSELEFGIQARCFSHGGATIRCDVPTRFIDR
ncbi:methyltransferase domain-containing protein [Bosea sp. LjRoot237]|uniref:methyltransferase domain-containing protein n=1 Tax=Bosea sp. LjRoot237 TaxID=3342292 RepID=UPI003ECDF2DC